MHLFREIIWSFLKSGSILTLLVMQKNKTFNLSSNFVMLLFAATLLLAISILSEYRLDHRLKDLPYSAMLTLTPWGLFDVFLHPDSEIIAKLNEASINYRAGLFQSSKLLLADIALLFVGFIILRKFRRVRE